MIHEGAFVRADGKVSDRKGELYMSNPKVETVARLPIGVGDSLLARRARRIRSIPYIRKAEASHRIGFITRCKKYSHPAFWETLADPIPEYILNTYSLPTLKTALVWIHAPQKQNDALAARKRFAFEEVFFIQLQKKRDR